jgi:hypothetical protein
VAYSAVTNARGLLHAAIVERLCGQCDALLVNGDDAYLMAPGTQHFQRLLGYEVVRLRLRRAPESPDGVQRRRQDRSPSSDDAGVITAP